MSSKYVVYVQVSTDKDEQVSSVENQIDICRNWLERNGYEWNEREVPLGRASAILTYPNSYD